MENTLKKFIYISIAMGVLVLISKKIFSKGISKNPFVGKNIVIGDSHGVMIGSKLKNAKAEPSLSKSGWMLSSLLTALSTYPPSPDVSNVFISIGTNGQYSKYDKIEQLVTMLKEKFPNAYFYAFKGSYGWSGRYGNPNAASDQIPYYKRFQDMGVTILNNGLGYFATDAQAHSTSSSQAKAIIAEINSIAYSK
jgi:hypothetical protein